MDDLWAEVQAFLNHEAAAATDPDIEICYELDCPLCTEDGFVTCQGHAYSHEHDTYLD